MSLNESKKRGGMGGAKKNLEGRDWKGGVFSLSLDRSKIQFLIGDTCYGEENDQETNQ